MKSSAGQSNCALIAESEILKSSCFTLLLLRAPRYVAAHGLLRGEVVSGSGVLAAPYQPIVHYAILLVWQNARGSALILSEHIYME